MKKILKIIPKNVTPILVIVFALSMLIGGGTYLFAVVTYPLPQVAPGNQLTAAAWNNLVDDINDLNSRINNPTLECHQYLRTSTLTCDQVCATNNMICIFGGDSFNGTVGPNYGIWGVVYRCGMVDSDIAGCACCRIRY